MLGAATFDVVHQPVSTCYVPKLAPVYAEVARVLRPGGVYISQHKQPTSLQVTHRDAMDRYVLGIEYYRSEALPHVPDRSYREAGAVEYLHSWEELVGELCRTGFLLEDLVEPDRSDRQAPPGTFCASWTLRRALCSAESPTAAGRRRAKSAKNHCRTMSTRAMRGTGSPQSLAFDAKQNDEF